jgi:hypothetical protein
MASKITPAPLTRPLSAIAREIIADYRSKGKPVHYSAVPYVEAMLSLDTLNDSVGYDDARSVVLYALSNLSTWRGPVATRVKGNVLLVSRN